MMAHGEHFEAVTITAATVRVGDVIVLGGAPLRVLRLSTVPGGHRRLVFFTGEILIIHRRTRLNAVRLIPASARCFRYNGRPVPSTPHVLRAFLDNVPLRPER